VNPAYALAAVTSGVFGTADFLGGFASRRASALTVTFVSGLAGLVSLCVAQVWIHGAPAPADFGWGLAAGLCGGTGVALLFRAYAIGPVSIAAPVISLVSLAVPVIAGIALGERPSSLAIGGIVLAAGAFPLLASTGERFDPRGVHAVARVVGIASASGVLVGGFLVFMSRVSLSAGLIPLFASRLVTVALFGTILGVRRAPFWPAASARRPTILSGLLDSFANVGYFIAVHHGALALVGTIISLSPVSTVLLARLVLRERWSVPQRWGLALATTAIVCVSLG